MDFRALYMSDLHTSNTLPFARRAGIIEETHPALVPYLTPGLMTSSYTDRLLDTLDVLVQLYEYAWENSIPWVFILGDLLDKRLLDGATLKAFMDVFLKLVDKHDPTTTIIIPGNHESHDASGSVYTVSALEHIRTGNVMVWNQRDQLDLRAAAGVRLVGFPYKPDEVARDEVRRIRDEDGSDEVALLMHQSLVGGKVGHWVNPDGIMPEDLEGFAAVLSGHFHTPQSVGAALYLGAPMHHNFGDSGDARGFWDITLRSDEHQMTMVSSRAPKFAVIDWRTQTFSDGSPVSGTPGDAYVEVQLTGTDGEIKSETSAIQDFLRQVESVGARVAKFRPTRITEKKARVAMEVTGGKITWPSAVSGYLDACDLTGLERGRLEALAKQALEEAER